MSSISRMLISIVILFAFVMIFAGLVVLFNRIKK